MDVLHIIEYIYGDERKYIRNKGQTSYSYTYIYSKPTITYNQKKKKINVVKKNGI